MLSRFIKYSLRSFKRQKSYILINMVGLIIETEDAPGEKRKPLKRQYQVSLE
jgi:hypothetical protein